jgi:hypothetical protein
VSSAGASNPEIRQGLAPTFQRLRHAVNDGAVDVENQRSAVPSGNVPLLWFSSKERDLVVA